MSNESSLATSCEHQIPADFSESMAPCGRKIPPRRRQLLTKVSSKNSCCGCDFTVSNLARRLRGLNSLAVPFLDEEDDVNADDDTFQPSPKPLRLAHLMALAFFAVSGSAYGIEETISLAGPFLTILALVLAPLLWSAPMLMVVTELSVALPHSGGYIIWVNTVTSSTTRAATPPCHHLY